MKYILYAVIEGTKEQAEAVATAVRLLGPVESARISEKVRLWHDAVTGTPEED